VVVAFRQASPFCRAASVARHVCFERYGGERCLLFLARAALVMRAVGTGALARVSFGGEGHKCPNRAGERWAAPAGFRPLRLKSNK
jgi:hypothetical protein